MATKESGEFATRMMAEWRTIAEDHFYRIGDATLEKDMDPLVRKWIKEAFVTGYSRGRMDALLEYIEGAKHAAGKIK